VAIPTNLKAEACIHNKPMNVQNLTTSLKPYVGMDCFVIGYPKGLKTKGWLPIWKRASIASDPDIKNLNEPVILIDTATRKGMSGSPVVMRHDGLYSPSGKFDSTSILGSVSNFLGVYSGRTDDDELGVQIGRVWKAGLIDEVFSNSELGLNPMHINTD